MILSEFLLWGNSEIDSYKRKVKTKQGIREVIVKKHDRQYKKSNELAKGMLLGAGLTGLATTGGLYFLGKKGIQGLRKNPKILSKAQKYLETQNIKVPNIEFKPRKILSELSTGFKLDINNPRNIPSKVIQQYNDNLESIGKLIRDGKINNAEFSNILKPEEDKLHFYISGRNFNRVSQTSNVTKSVLDSILLNTKKSPASTAIDVHNSWTNGTVDNPIYDSLFVLDTNSLLYKIVKNKTDKKFLQDYSRMYYQGYDETAVNTASQIFSNYKKYGDSITYNIYGHSSGSKPAIEAYHILKSAGIPEENLRVISFGGEASIGVPNPKNSLHIIDKADNSVRNDIYPSIEYYQDDSILHTNINWKKEFPEVVGTLMEGHVLSNLAKTAKSKINSFTKNKIKPNLQPFQQTRITQILESPKAKMKLEKEIKIVSEKIERNKKQLQNIGRFNEEQINEKMQNDLLYLNTLKSLNI